MTVVARAAIPADAFALGDVLRTDAAAEIELTRLVSLDAEVFPYFWAATDGTDSFEAEVRADPRVDRLIRHDERAGNALYHVEWARGVDGFLAAARQRDVVVERGVGTAEEWTFRLRAPDRSTLRSFREDCRERDLPLRIRGPGTELPFGTAREAPGVDGASGPAGEDLGTADPSAREGGPTEGVASPFREIVENLDEVVWMTDPDKEEVLYVNAAYEEVWGRPRERLYEEPLSFLDAIHPDDCERVRAALGSQSEGEYDETYRIVRPDGSVRWVRDRAVPIRNGEGDVYRVAGIAEDITQRTEREQELARTSRTLEALSDSFPDPAFVIDEDGYYRESLAGPEAESLLAAAPDDLLDVRLRDVLPTDVAERIRSVIRRSLDTGDLQTLEYRLDVPDGTRWFEARVTPMQSTDRDARAVVFVARDVTERKNRERILSALHEATGDLLRAETPQRAAEVAAVAAREILDYPNSVVRLVDEAGERLLPVAVTDTAQTEMGERPTYPIDDTPVGEAYRTGEPVLYEDIRTVDDEYDRGVVRGVMYLPMGSHGTISIADTAPGEFDQADVELAQILATNAAAAMDRIEREERLERQNERLVELSRLNGLIRRTHRAVVDPTTREGIATNVCETLVEGDPYVAAWLGTHRTEREVAVLAAAGPIRGGDGTGRVPSDDGTLTDELFGTAHRTRAVHVIPDLHEANADPWHERLLDRGCRAGVAIPLAAGEALYGVLVLYSDQPDAFNDETVSVLQELGRTIGRTIRAARTRRALVADSAVELEFGVTGSTSFFVTASDDLECRLRLEGLVPLDGERLLYYVTAEGCSPDALRDYAAETTGIETCRMISETGEGAVFEFRVAGASAVRALMDYVATVSSAVADHGTGRVVAEVAPNADARTVLNGLQEECPSARLIGKRTLDRPVRTVQQFRKRLADRLTDKQLNALRTAYFAGYFEWPRGSTAEEIAESMEISSSTFHFHLRHASRKLLQTFLEAQHAE